MEEAQASLLEERSCAGALKFPVCDFLPLEHLISLSLPCVRHLPLQGNHEVIHSISNQDGRFNVCFEGGTESNCWLRMPLGYHL